MPVPVQRERPDLSNGGVIAVFLGEGAELPTLYQTHPLVLPIEAWKLNAKMVDGAIPSNTRAAVFGHGKRLDRDIFTSIHEVLKKRRLAYLMRDSEDAVAETLVNLLPPANRPRLASGLSPSEIREQEQQEQQRKIAARGSLKGFVTKHYPELLKEQPLIGVAEASRHLFRIAQREGLGTTVGSIAQAIRIAKRDLRLTTRPASATPERLLVLTRIDNAIAELQACRSYIGELEAKNADLEAKVAKAKEVFTAFGPDVFGDR